MSGRDVRDCAECEFNRAAPIASSALCIIMPHGLFHVQVQSSISDWLSGVELLLSPYNTCKMLVLQRTASNSIEYEGRVDFVWIIVLISKVGECLPWSSSNLCQLSAGLTCQLVVPTC